MSEVNETHCIVSYKCAEHFNVFFNIGENWIHLAVEIHGKE